MYIPSSSRHFQPYENLAWSYWITITEKISGLSLAVNREAECNKCSGSLCSRSPPETGCYAGGEKTLGMKLPKKRVMQREKFPHDLSPCQCRLILGGWDRFHQCAKYVCHHIGHERNPQFPNNAFRFSCHQILCRSPAGCEVEMIKKTGSMVN